MIRISVFWMALLVCNGLMYSVTAQTDTITQMLPDLVGNGHHDYPSIDSVASQFASLYGDRTEIVSFEKRPDGYWVVLTKPGLGDEDPLRELIWSRADGQWKPLTIEPSASAGDPARLVQSRFYYNRVPYYGYRGWFRDVIQLLDGKPDLPPDQEFSLATAWFERASSLLSNQYGSADSLETFKLPNTKNALNPAQLELFLNYTNKALAHYERWAKGWPEDETVVGPASVKLANQYMTAFMQLQYFQNEETAMQILDRPPLSYNDFLLESARNLLRCCPPNAVLITYGDNDTYPLLYVQAKQGFRRDVMVANISLLFTGRYINFFRDRIFDAPPLKLQCSPECYLNDTTAILYLLSGNKPTPMSEFLDYLNGGKWERAYGYPVSSASSVYFYTDKSGTIHKAGANTLKKGYKVEIPLAPESYIRRDQLAILDFLYSNSPERPLCFSTTCSQELVEPYKNHLRLQALVYRFDPKPVKVSSEMLKGTIDLKASYRLFAKELEYQSHAPLTSDGILYQSILMYYSMLTARELADSKQLSRAEKLMDRYLEAFPNERKVFDHWHLQFVELYEKIGKPKKALALARQLVENIEQGRLGTTNRSQIIQQIHELALEHGDQSLLARVEKL